MMKRNKIKHLCLLTLTVGSLAAISGCSGQQAAQTVGVSSTAASQEPLVTGDGEAEPASGETAALPEIEDVFIDSPYLSWTITDEFNELTAPYGSVLINWDEAAGTGTILTDGDQVSRANVKELIFYSVFGTYTIDAVTSPEGVELEVFSGSDQKLILPDAEAEDKTVLSLSVRYELTLETKDLTVTILP